MRPTTFLAAARRTPFTLAALGAAGLLVLAGCGGGQTGSAGTVPANPDLTVIARDIKFDMKTYAAPAGDIKIAYDSQGQQVHSMVFKDASGQRIPDFRLQVAPGKKTGGSVNLPAGTYTMYCDIPGHEAAGMVAQVTVG